jgi:hypothetical protein
MKFKISNNFKILIALSFLSLTNLINAATLGEQEFGLVGKTGNCIFISEDIGGEYHLSRFLTLVIGGNGFSLGKIELEKYKQWDWVEDWKENLRLEDFSRIRKTESEFQIGEKQHVQAPAGNDKLLEEFKAHLRKGGSNGVSWNKKMGKAGMIPPVCKGFDVKNTYYYPGGLYVNYEIAKAFCFERSGVVLLFTENPERSVGLDTMHGFIVLQTNLN